MKVFFVLQAGCYGCVTALTKTKVGPSGMAGFLTGHPHQKAVCKTLAQDPTSKASCIQGWLIWCTNLISRRMWKVIILKGKYKLTENKKTSIATLLCCLAAQCPKDCAAQAIL